MELIQPPNMRVVTILFVLLASMCAPIATATHSQASNSSTDIVEENTVIETYSPAVQASLRQKSDLSTYTQEQLHSAQQWVVISQYQPVSYTHLTLPTILLV